MDSFLNMVSAWFTSFGIPPLVGAFALGALASFLAFRRSDVRMVGGPGIITDTRTAIARIDGTVKYNGRDYAVPPEVFTHVEGGDKISAIKALRAATAMELIDAKNVVDALFAMRSKAA